jgi:transcriptional regulator with XRE-family HTH domain
MNRRTKTSPTIYAAKIEQLRKEKAYTQEKLADLSKVSSRTIQRLEQGHPGRLRTLDLVATSLGVTPEQLFHNDHDVKPNASSMHGNKTAPVHSDRSPQPPPGYYWAWSHTYGRWIWMPDGWVWGPHGWLWVGRQQKG